MEDIRLEIAYLSLPPSRVLAGDGNLTVNHQEWAQDSGLWSILYYHHANAITINTRTYAITPGDIALIPPGSAATHAVVGDNTWFDYISFNLPATTGIRLAIPLIHRQMQSHLPNLRKASNRIVDTGAAAVAFAWNFMWLVSSSATLYRENEILYLAEDFIRRNLERKFSVQEIADAAEVSPRTLLKAFRTEHGTTLQEYILRKRVQEASRLLLKTEMSIKEIAARVGMSDPQYFNKTMRSITGMAPSKLRASQYQTGGE